MLRMPRALCFRARGPPRCGCVPRERELGNAWVQPDLRRKHHTAHRFLSMMLFVFFLTCTASRAPPPPVHLFRPQTLPAASSEVGFRVVAHSSGVQPLPDVQLTACGLDAARLVLLAPQRSVSVSPPVMLGGGHNGSTTMAAVARRPPLLVDDVQQ